MSDPVSLRNYNPAIKGEEAFLYSTWLRDLRAADPSGLPDEFWFPAHRAHIQALLADPAILVLVACSTESPEDILGYIIAKPNEVLEWLHVRRNLRNHGLGRRLLEAAQAGPAVPARWRTQDSRARLKNPWRGRDLRRSSSTASGTGSR